MMQTAPRILLAVSLALVLAFGAGPDTRAYDRPEGSSGFTQKTLAKAKRHMVVAANPLAAEAGLATLRKGGSAVDAAIAVQMVLNVVEPQSSDWAAVCPPHLGSSHQDLAEHRRSRDGA